MEEKPEAETREAAPKSEKALTEEWWVKSLSTGVAIKRLAKEGNLPKDLEDPKLVEEADKISKIYFSKKPEDAEAKSQVVTEMGEVFEETFTPYIGKLAEAFLTGISLF